jgi:pimeloyl-ACP methyl ester carboxylesterase
MDQHASPAPANSRQAALADLLEAVRQLEGLTEQVGPFALPLGTCDRVPELVSALCHAVDVPLSFDAPSPTRGQDFAAVALAAEIQRAQRAPVLVDVRPAQVPELAARARQLRDEQDGGYRRHTVRRADGALIAAIDVGPLDAPCVLLSSACAMSYRLTLPWLRALGSRYRCVVPQTRGTNGRIDEPESFDRSGYGVVEQAGDLAAVIEALGLDSVHLMGLCGGAVPALVLAADRPDAVRSLSLWHADLELAGESQKSDHQINLRAVLDLAGESRETAAWMRERLISGPLTGVPAGIGPLVVRPYAADELFYRYAKLTAATMHWDSRSTATRVAQPCLIVTSRDDHTAHPDGSRRLAEILSDAQLVMTDHGTHLDAFNATTEQLGYLSPFLTRHDGAVPGLRDNRVAPLAP